MSNHFACRTHGVSGKISAALVLLMTATLLAACGNARKIDAGGGDVYYTENVQEPDAKKLADYLAGKNYFSKGQDKAQLDKTGEVFIFRMVVPKGSHEEKQYGSESGKLSLDLSKNVFNNARVAIDLCDDDFNVLKSFEPPSRNNRAAQNKPVSLKHLKLNGGVLGYTTQVDSVEAVKLGEFLVKDGYFNGKPIEARFAKNVFNHYAFMIKVKPGREQDPKFISQCRAYGAKISRDVFNNRPVDVHLCDTTFQTRTIVQLKSIKKVNPTAATTKPNS